MLKHLKRFNDWLAPPPRTLNAAQLQAVEEHLLLLSSTTAWEAEERLGDVDWQRATLPDWYALRTFCGVAHALERVAVSAALCALAAAAGAYAAYGHADGPSTWWTTALAAALGAAGMALLIRTPLWLLLAWPLLFVAGVLFVWLRSWRAFVLAALIVLAAAFVIAVWQSP